MTQKSYTLLHLLHHPGQTPALTRTTTRPDPLRLKSAPCAVCGRPVKQGDGVWLQDGRRLCLEELAEPLPPAVVRPKTN
jgi:hypothetical protein